MIAFRSRLVSADDPRLRDLGIGRLDDAFALEGETVTLDPRSRVLRLAGPAGAVFLKRFVYPSGPAALLRFLAPSHCRREAANFAVLRRLGIGCPEVLAWGEERRFGLPRRAFLVSAEIPGATPLEDLLESGALDSARRRRLIEGLAGQVAHMHEAGYLDRDLKFRNILVAADDAIYHVDSPKGRRGSRPLGPGAAARDLGMLDKHAPRFLSAPERLRFLASYARRRGLDPAVRRDLARRVLERAGELHGRGRTG